MILKLIPLALLFIACGKGVTEPIRAINPLCSEASTDGCEEVNWSITKRDMPERIQLQLENRIVFDECISRNYPFRISRTAGITDIYSAAYPMPGKKTFDVKIFDRKNCSVEKSLYYSSAAQTYNFYDDELRVDL